MRPITLRALPAGLAMPALLWTVTAAAAPAGSDAPKPDKPVCRDLEVTGSIMTKRVCHTRGEWDALRTASQRKMDERHNDNTIDRSQGRGNILEGS